MKEIYCVENWENLPEEMTDTTGSCKMSFAEGISAEDLATYLQRVAERPCVSFEITDDEGDVTFTYSSEVPSEYDRDYALDEVGTENLPWLADVMGIQLDVVDDDKSYTPRYAYKGEELDDQDGIIKLIALVKEEKDGEEKLWDAFAELMSDVYDIKVYLEAAENLIESATLYFSEKRASLDYEDGWYELDFGEVFVSDGIVMRGTKPSRGSIVPAYPYVSAEGSGWNNASGELYIETFKRMLAEGSAILS